MAELRMREALRDAMAEEMRRDESVFVMGEDVGVFRGAFKVTDGLLDEFGERRVRDTPISENTIVGAGVGAAMNGLRPIVELMTVNFSLLALDQIVNHAAAIPYMFNGQAKVPMVIRMPGGGGHQLGPTHSHSFEALYLQVPGLLVACPSTPGDAKGLLKSAIRDDNPVVFIEHESLYGIKGEVDDDPDTLLPFGEAKVRREGTDVTIVGILKMANVAMEAAETLASEHGVSAEVIDPRTLRPLDLDTILDSVAKTNRVGDRRGGLAARRRRRQPLGPDHRAGLRPPRRPAPAGHRRRRPHALLQTPRAGRDPAPGAHRQRRARDPRGGDGLMAEIVMPRLSDSMEEGTVLKWMKQVGDEVAVGDELVEIETDKANMAYESDVAGTLTRDPGARRARRCRSGRRSRWSGTAASKGPGSASQAAGPVTAGDPPSPPVAKASSADGPPYRCHPRRDGPG